MLDFIKFELQKFKIDLVSCISLDKCDIVRPYLLEKNGIESGSVIIFAVPYFFQNKKDKSNISTYAISRDYHLFFESLFSDVISTLKTKFPDNKFIGFTDHSPINEIKAASKSGLGIIGKNHLLITEKYSSFVFIGEIITDAVIPSETSEILHCENCGICLASCPAKMDISKCLSSITQKKGNLSDEEINFIEKHECAWGCDICQTVCPHTKKAIKNGTIYDAVNREPYVADRCDR